VPFEVGNRTAERHGFYAAPRELTPEAAALADDLMALPHISEGDPIAARPTGGTEGAAVFVLAGVRPARLTKSAPRGSLPSDRR
jgi:hypothetical protein